jgi:CHAT domain-containing protein
MKILRCFCFYVLILLFPQIARAEKVAENDTFAIYLNKGIESRNNEQPEKSINELFVALKYSVRAQDSAKVYNFLGSDFFELSDYHTALLYYDSSLAITDTINQVTFLGYLYNNYGLAYMQLMDFEKAIDFYRKSVLFLNKESIGILYYNISLCYGYLGKKDSARYYLDKSYSNNVKALGENSYYTLLAELALAEISGEISNSLKRRILKSSNDFLKGEYFIMAGDFKQAEKYVSSNSLQLLVFYTKIEKWDKAIAVIDSLRTSFLSIESKLFLQAYERSIYKNAIDEALVTDTLLAFKIALKSHSNVLKEDIEDNLNDNYPESYNYIDFDSLIYLFIINDGVKYYRIEADSLFRHYYNQFLSSFNLRKILDNFMCNYREYAESSYYLFKKLLPQIQDQILIIPEGRIQYLPFEAFLTEFPDTTIYPIYSEMPYLINKADIRYDYILREYKKPMGKKKIIAMAPYESLDYTIKEVKNLSRYNSRILIGDKAESSWIYKGDILHIASHYDPREYSLQFADKVLGMDSLIKQQKDLVVLSTCYSGFGKRYEGEGSFSASRAFYISGAESVVESIWLNDDRSSYIIFSHFYRNLSKGMLKGTSLAMAKKQHLKECPSYLTHPYFWSNFRFFGNNYPVDIQKRTNWLFITTLIVILVVLFYYFFGLQSK